jgi:hypothetical protein
MRLNRLQKAYETLETYRHTPVVLNPGVFNGGALWQAACHDLGFPRAVLRVEVDLDVSALLPVVLLPLQRLFIEILTHIELRRILPLVMALRVIEEQILKLVALLDLGKHKLVTVLVQEVSVEKGLPNTKI